MKIIEFNPMTRLFYIKKDGKIIDTATSRLEAEIKRAS